MELPVELIDEFSSILSYDDKTEENQNSTFYGTIHKENGQTYVKIDGFNDYTPVANTTETLEGDRVVVDIRNHQAIISGNVTSPPSGRNATNYMKFDDGLIIGNVSEDTLGSNVFIKSDELDIRNGGIVNASFAEDEISLGKNSDSSIIKMCEEKGYILYDSDDPAVDGGCFTIGTDSWAGFKVITYDGENAFILGSNSIRMSTGAESRVGPVLTFSPDSSEIYINTLLRIKKHGSENYRVAIGTGQAGINRGIYDDFANAWMMYCDEHNLRLGAPDTGLWKPYYSKGDSIACESMTGGFVSSSSATVHFTIYLAKPILGNPSVSVTTPTDGGLIVRQGGNYCYGSAAGSYAKPASYEATINSDGNAIQIKATYSKTTNAVNNDACGIQYNVKLTFN